MARARDERGLLLSSPLALLSAGAVVLAGAAFVATNGPRQQAESPRAAVVRSTPTVAPAGPARPQVVKRKHAKPAPRPAVRRGETYVEVYNNSGISGLAGRTAGKARGAGWQVVGSDNWYGTIPASTVYFPERLRAEDIPIAGRICSICDVYDALVSPRPYKEAWPVADALAEIAAQSGRQFDPQLVEAFVGLFADEQRPARAAAPDAAPDAAPAAR